MRDRLFGWIAGFVYSHNTWSLVAVLLLTVVLGGLSERLRMEMTWIDIVPEDEPSVQEFDRLLSDYGVLTSIVVAVDGPDEARVKEAVRELAPELAALKEHVRRVDYRVDADYLRRHGFMLMKAKDLERMKDIVVDLNLAPLLTHVNDDLEREYVADEGNLARREREALTGLDGIMAVLEAMGDAAAGGAAGPDGPALARVVDLFTLGETYYLSDDRRMALLLVQPTCSMNDIEPTARAVNAIEAALAEYQADNPDLRVGQTGMHVILRDEMTAGISDTVRNLIFAFLLILILFMVSFRMLSAPVLAMLTLIVGITWDMGLTALLIGRLNIMTAMMAVVLLGLGVDYTIHLISAYTELRGRGGDVEESLRGMFAMVGNGLLTGALTTAIAFLALLFTSFRMLEEVGLVTGVGILTCLAAALFLMPALLVLRERVRRRFGRGKAEKRTDLTFNFISVAAIPLVLGIGIDDGVHIIHRYSREGRGNLPLVMASTGRAILLTSLTTMLAFGSLVGSAYRGYVCFGAVMFAGVGFCLISSAIVLPSILALVYDRERKTGVD